VLDYSYTITSIFLLYSFFIMSMNFLSVLQLLHLQGRLSYSISGHLTTW
jgi:hypothetical protein